MSQNDRIKMKLARDGFVTRNECLRQYPAITRLGARIQDLETKYGYEFETEDTGRDYIYRLVSIKGNVNRAALAFFDNYQPTHSH